MHSKQRIIAMKKGKKIIITGTVLLLVIATIVSFFFWYAIGQPLYEPGMVRAESQLRAPLNPPAQPEKESYWQVEQDIKLEYFSAGSGKNILIVHGGPGSPDAKPWRGLAVLTETHRFHYYAQRGSGQSSRPIDTFSSASFYDNMKTLESTLGISAQLADIERIRRILGAQKLTIIGHSFGAFLAALYAAEFPERVAALVLVSPADVLVMPDKDGSLYEAVREKLPANMRAEYAAYLKELLDFKHIFSKSESDLKMLNQGFAKYYTAATKSILPEQGEPGGWMVQAMFFSLGRKHDYRDIFKNVSAPVLVIHGVEDLQSEDASRMYVEAFPNARLELIREAGHFPYHEQPEAFSLVVGNFLRSLA
jgi:proline iminopeptidase